MNKELIRPKISSVIKGFEKPQMKKLLNWGANEIFVSLSTIQNHLPEF